VTELRGLSFLGGFNVAYLRAHLLLARVFPRDLDYQMVRRLAGVQACSVMRWCYIC
jgi:hypothetical protein